MATDDLEARQRRLERRQAMADALMAQSMQAPQGQMVSGHYVAPSPFEYLAKAGQQFLGNRAQRNLDKQQDSLETEQRQMMATALQDYLKSREGDPYAAATLAATSEHKPLQQLGLAELKELNKPETWKTGGARRDPVTGELVEVLVSNRGNERRSDFASAPEMRVADGVAYDPRTIKPGQTVGRNPNDLTLLQQEQLKLQQANVQSMIEARNQQAEANQQGRIPAGYRVTADGSGLEAIPGGPADVKAQALAQQQATGATDVDLAIGTLRDAYDRLDKGGGITSTEKNWASNAIASASSSGIGQALGKQFGTDNQSARNDIAMARPALLAALMKATGMSAKQMDSNAELKLWLATATDPTLDVESNRRALDNIEKKYLGVRDQQQASTGGSSNTFKSSSGIQFTVD